MYDLICVGGVSIDLYFQGKSLTQDRQRFHLAIGGKYQTDFFYEDIGGGGVNVAVGVAKHGLTAAVFGKIGDTGYRQLIIDRLLEKKVGVEFLQVEKKYYKLSAILLTDNGERTVIHYESPTHLQHEFFLHQDLKKAENIYFSPLPHISLKEKEKMIDYLKGDRTLTFVNLSVVDCRRPVVQLIKIFTGLDVLFINGHEFAELVKKPYTNLNFQQELEKLPVLSQRTVIITDGEKGSYGFYRGQSFFQPAVTCDNIIDTTGAGDAYTAGFIAEYLQSKDIKKSMANGADYAAKILAKIGAN